MGAGKYLFTLKLNGFKIKKKIIIIIEHLIKETGKYS